MVLVILKFVLIASTFHFTAYYFKESDSFQQNYTLLLLCNLYIYIATNFQSSQQINKPHIYSSNLFLIHSFIHLNHFILFFCLSTWDQTCLIILMYLPSIQLLNGMLILKPLKKLINWYVYAATIFNYYMVYLQYRSNLVSWCGIFFAIDGYWFLS
jgi:hypothetical protein